MSKPQSKAEASKSPAIFNSTSSAIDTKASTDEPWSVQSALSKIPQTIPTNSPSPSSPLPFLHLLERLKTTPREGWRRFNINHGESISDHMYRMSIITMLAPPSLISKLNIPHCTRMALIHDMAECLVGDITPKDNIAKEEKARREAETMEYLCGTLLGGLGNESAGKGIQEVFEEYEEAKTKESVFVHDIDKIELLLQMVEYERRGEGNLDLGEFTRVAKKIVGEEVKDWAREILRERKEYWEGVGKKPTFMKDEDGI